MVHDTEKQDLEAIQHVPEDLDGPIQHPGVSTARDGEYGKQFLLANSFVSFEL